MSRFTIALVLTASFFLTHCGESLQTEECTRPESNPIQTPIGQVKSWMYQIQDLDDGDAVDILAASDYELLVIEPGDDFTESPYNTPDIISRLRLTPDGRRRLLIAYIDIGEAEDYRSYWQTTWIAPTATSRGVPEFLITIDPDGWTGNYPVAYWDTAWKSIWIGPNARIEQLARLGFDGIYLDWVEAYDDEKVREAALQQGVVPETEMMDFMDEMRSAGRSINPDFVVVPQNAPYLIDFNLSRYVSIIDALAVEDTWFHGAGDADWDDPDAGDLHDRHEDEFSSESRLAQYRIFQANNIPVFSVDYCISRGNARTVYCDAWNNGLIPLVTRVSLSRNTETPQP